MTVGKYYDLADREEDAVIEDLDETDFVSKPSLLEQISVRDLIALVVLHARVHNGLMFKKDIATECYEMADRMMEQRR